MTFKTNLIEYARKKYHDCNKILSTPGIMFLQALRDASTDQETMYEINSYIHRVEEKNQLWIYLVMAEKVVKEYGFSLNCRRSELFQSLREHEAYIGDNIPHRFPDEQKLKKSWKFDLRKMEEI